jgi:hypothetical protein
MTPSVGRIVHRVAPTSHRCQAAIITSVTDTDVGLYVLDERGGVAFYATSIFDATAQGDHTWHWPERVSE